jgi:hypothetical protein
MHPREASRWRKAGGRPHVPRWSPATHDATFVGTMSSPLDDLAQAATTARQMSRQAKAPDQPSSIQPRDYAASNRTRIRDGFFFGIGFWLAGMAFTVTMWLLVVVLAGLGIASCSLIGRSATSAPTFPPPSHFYHR